jgi:hypothetical protein
VHFYRLQSGNKTIKVIITFKNAVQTIVIAHSKQSMYLLYSYESFAADGVDGYMKQCAKVKIH